MPKHTTICAGIDTGKRKLDVALEGDREQKAQRNQRIYFYAQIILALAASLSLVFYLFRLWRTRTGKTEG